MSKAYSKAAKRRRKRRNLGLPELAPVPRREPNGRVQREPIDRDPARHQLEARCRHMNEEPTDAQVREKRAPWWGCHAGRVIATAAITDEERADLWDAIQHMRITAARYDAAIGAPHRHAACVRILATADKMDASHAKPIDDRTPEEIERAAVSAYMQVEGWLGHTHTAGASEARRVVLDDQHPRNPAFIIAALRCVSDGIHGRAGVFRT